MMEAMMAGMADFGGEIMGGLEGFGSMIGDGFGSMVDGVEGMFGSGAGRGVGGEAGAISSGSTSLPASVGGGPVAPSGTLQAKASMGGMMKDKSWMHQGMQAALKGMSRGGLGGGAGLGGGTGGAGGFAPSGSVSAKGDSSAISEINKMVKGSPPLQDLGKYSKLFG